MSITCVLPHLIWFYYQLNFDINPKILACLLVFHLALSAEANYVLLLRTGFISCIMCVNVKEEGRKEGLSSLLEDVFRIREGKARSTRRMLVLFKLIFFYNFILHPY